MCHPRQESYDYAKGHTISEENSRGMGRIRLKINIRIVVV
jgi:hypothetical protein